MRRQFLGALLFAGTLAFTACQNETVIYLDENGNPIENVELKEGEGLLKINLSNTSANSRTARPVGSSAAANNVNTVKVYVYSNTGKDKAYKLDTNIGVASDQNGISMTSSGSGIILINNYTGDSETDTDHSEYASDRHDVATIKLTGLQASTTYKFVAVGYNAGTAGGANPYGDNTDFATNWYATTTALTGDKGYEVEELFAGTSTGFTTKENKKFETAPSVVIERQVAGMLAYFTNVPTKVDDNIVQYIRVYANDEYTTFNYPFATDFNGETKKSTAESNGKYLLMEFDMSKSATNWNASTQSETTYRFNQLGTGSGATGNEVGGAEGQNYPLAIGYTAPAGLKLVQNSIFGGRYIIPYKAHVDSQTLTVELQNATGEALRTLNVTTTQKPTDVSGGTLDGAHAYDIRRNNFYSIGQKFKTDSTDGGDEDDDKPIDLSGNTDIVVTINDAWKVLHNMGVEEL